MTLTAITPEIRTRIFTDPDRFRLEPVPYERIAYTVLKRGAFRAEVTSAQIGRVLVWRCREALPRLSKAGLPPNMVAILTWLRRDQLPVVRGLQIEPGDAIYCGECTESYHRTSGQNDYILVVLDSGLLKQAIVSATGREPKGAPCPVLRPPDHLRGLLASVLGSALHAVATWPHLLASPLSVTAMEQSILQALALCIEQSEGLKERSQRRHRAILAKRFEAAVEASLDQHLSIPELCRSIGASDRMLRSLCQEQLGMSPVRFVAMRRMQRIRQALLSADYGSVTVTDIAMQFGVWELGRFAASYKALFGEPPSATLRHPR